MLAQTTTRSATTHGSHHRHAPSSAAANPSAAPTDGGQTIIVQDPAQPTPTDSSHGAAWFSLGGGLLALILLIVAVRWAIRLMTHDSGTDPSAAAVTGVPHCSYEETPEGFKVRFRRLPRFIQGSIYNSFDTQRTQAGRHGGGLASIAHIVGLLIGTLITLSVGFLCWLWVLVFPTTIVVARDTITLGGKTVPLSQFGGFTNGAVIEYRGKLHPVTRLAYRHGHQDFDIGGGWRQRQAEAVARALNARLEDHAVRPLPDPSPQSTSEVTSPTTSA